MDNNASEMKSSKARALILVVAAPLLVLAMTAALQIGFATMAVSNSRPWSHDISTAEVNRRGVGTSHLWHSDSITASSDIVSDDAFRESIEGISDQTIRSHANELLQNRGALQGYSFGWPLRSGSFGYTVTTSAVWWWDGNWASVGPFQVMVPRQLVNLPAIANGSIASVVCFGLFVGAIQLARVIRRRLAIRRGKCLCGYPIVQSASVCPECGRQYSHHAAV